MKGRDLLFHDMFFPKNYYATYKISDQMNKFIISTFLCISADSLVTSERTRFIASFGLSTPSPVRTSNMLNGQYRMMAISLV